jgi:hypothetical protein
MKKLVVLLLIALLGISLVSAAKGTTGPFISATLQSQDPDPVEPGQVVKVKFKIENDGEATNDDVIVTLMPKKPFSLYGDVAVKNIGAMPAASTGKDAVTVTYTIKVAEDAVEEETELELKVEYGRGGISYVEDQFLIDIETHDAVLDITSIVLDPVQVPPGESGEVTIGIKNMADSLLKDIKLKLEFGDADLPLAPYKSSSERRLAQLQSGFQNALKFSLIADPEAKPGLYKIPLNITYNDERGNSFHVKDILAVTIGEAPKVRPFIKKSSVLNADAAGKVTITVANAGASDIKFLELALLPSEDYQLVSTTDYFYIGDVDSDDTESEEIDIYIPKKIKKVVLPVRLKYYDANNKPFQQQFNLEMDLYSTQQLKKFGLVESSKAGVYIFLILLAGAGFYWYRRTKK